jgi:hypothetical protein
VNIAMVHQRKFVLTDGTSKTLPLELQSLNINDEWKHVMHASIDEIIALKQFATRMQICMIATVCFLFCTLPVMMIVGRKKERALLQHMQER